MPPDDFAALRGAIYINKRWDEGASYEEIHAIKGELMAKYGNRGRKINNLLSSGYFEDTIIPLYNEMAKYPNFTGAAFLERYSLIVDEEAFALFVNSRMMADALPTMIHSKIRRNLKYGVNYVTIHGLGKENVEHVKEILMDVEVNYSILRKEIEETGFWIKVKYWFDKSKTKSL